MKRVSRWLAEEAEASGANLDPLSGRWIEDPARQDGDFVRSGRI